MLDIMHTIKSLRHELWLEVCRRRPLQQNKIILWSDNFKTFGCSPKYIALYLAEHYPEKYDIVWVLEREKAVPADLPAGIRIVRYFSMEYLKEIATAKVVVCNHRTSDYHFFRKRKGQYYIQTWHSALRLKKSEADAPQLPDSYKQIAMRDSQKIDLLLAGSRFIADFYRYAFWYTGEILEKGTPRCDCFFNDPTTTKRKVYDYFKIPVEKKVALYAPTFRKNKTAETHGMDFIRLQNTLGEDWVVGCRLHPNIDTQPLEGECVPMSKYPDMQELLIACDLLITDYSSCMFDMAVAEKKCVLYMPDLDYYIQNERELNFNINELPFPKAYNMDDLCKAVFDFDSYKDKLAFFLQDVGCCEEGNAAQAVAQRIQEVCR